MLDYVFGLLLIGLGIKHTPLPAAVLGDETETNQQLESTSSTSGRREGTELPERPNVFFPTKAAELEQRDQREASRPGLRLLMPVLSKHQEEAFLKERKIREAKIKAVSESRTEALHRSFANVLEKRKQEEKAHETAFIKRVGGFTDANKKQKVLDVQTKFQTIMTNSVTTIQKRLEALLALLDKISVSAAALATQGKDVSQVNSDITAAQAKVTTALTLTQSVAAAIPLSLSVSGESSAGAELGKGISDARKQFLPLYNAFVDARKAVNVAVSDLELLTKPVEVTPTPASP